MYFFIQLLLNSLSYWLPVAVLRVFIVLHYKLLYGLVVLLPFYVALHGFFALDFVAITVLVDFGLHAREASVRRAIRITPGLFLIISFVVEAGQLPLARTILEVPLQTDVRATSRGGVLAVSQKVGRGIDVSVASGSEPRNYRQCSNLALPDQLSLI